MGKNIFILFIIAFITSFSYGQNNKMYEFLQKAAEHDKQKALKRIKKIGTYNGNNIDVKYCRFEWNIDPDTSFISGCVTTYFSLNENNVDRIKFDFGYNMKVDSIIHRKQKVVFTLDSSNTLSLSFKPSLNINSGIDSVSVYYYGNPDTSGFGSFVKAIHDTIKKTPIIWTLSEPYGAKDWWPCKNNLSDKIDSCDIFVTAPSKYKTASNGILISEKIVGSNTVSHWKHRYPIAAYLVAIAVTDYVVSTDTFVGKGYKVPILEYIYPENFIDVQSKKKRILESFHIFDSLLTPYPFRNEKYGMAQFGWGGGMEHQTMTFIHNFDYELMAHELCHSWFGNYITCGSWHDIWINEGLTSYITAITYQVIDNGIWWKIGKKMVINEATKYVDGKVYCDDTTSVARIFSSYLSYHKGAMILHMLRWKMGDAKFYQILRNFLNDPKLAYSYAKSEDFIKHCEAVYGSSLKPFFDDWLYGEGYPTYLINCVQNTKSLNMKIKIDQIQSHPSVSFYEMPVPIMFKWGNKDTTITFNHEYSGQIFEVSFDNKVDSVFFDPENWIVSRNNKINLIHQQTDLETNLTIYPNLITDELKIQCKNLNISDISIYDIKGYQRFYNYENTNPCSDFIINIAEYSPGIYYIKINLYKGYKLYKFVKL